MKKTLIALAALAATGASFAQATISGNFGMSWQQDPAVTATGGHTQGLRVNDGEIYLTATENLGGGMSATARGGLTIRGRGTAIADRDGTVTLTGPFGSLTAGAVRSCGSLVTVQSGVVTGTTYSANESQNAVPLDKCSMVDVVAFSAPVGPIMLTGTYGEFGSPVAYAVTGTVSGTAAAAVAPATTGVVTGTATGTASASSMAGNSNGITFTDLAGVYKAGPLMVGANVTVFGAVGALKVIDGVVRTRVVGTYDAGVAKVGLGYQNKTGGSADQYVASVAVPMGNATFGLDYTARAAQGVFDNGAAGAAAALALSTARNGDKASSSVGVGMTYNFSKTTNLNASYITYTDAGANALASIAPVLDTEYRIRLLKSF